MTVELDLKSIAERLIAQIDSHIPDCASETHQEPVTFYRDPKYFEREKWAIFRRTPVFGGWSAELAEAGSFKTLSIADVEILLTRDKKGGLRGFHNVCRHRGMLLTQDKDGCASRFTCPYHGWTYDNEGTLIGLPFKQGFPGVGKESHSLIPIQVAEKYGMIFLRIEGREPVDVDDHLGGLGPQLGSFGWSEWKPKATNQVNISVNWKLIMDGFCEGYHFSLVHAKSLGANVIQNTHVVDAFDKHIREAFGNHGLRAMKELSSHERAEPALGADIGLVYLIFPNLVLLCLNKSGVDAISVWPGETVGATAVTESPLLGSNLEGAEREAVEQKIKFNWETVIQGEDFPLSEAAWKSVKSGSIDQFIFGRNELPLQHLHKHYSDVARR